MNAQIDNNSHLVIYGHHFCPQAQFLVSSLDKHEVDYEWRDVMEGEPRYQEELRQLANGHLSVPTVIFSDGTIMIEPWPGRVLKKLGLKKPGWFERVVTKLLNYQTT